MAKQGVTAFFKGIYQDDFKWALVKSIGIFALGIRIAQECAGMELLPSQSEVNSLNMSSRKQSINYLREYSNKLNECV